MQVLKILSLILKLQILIIKYLIIFITAQYGLCTAVSRIIAQVTCAEMNLKI